MKLTPSAYDFMSIKCINLSIWYSLPLTQFAGPEPSGRILTPTHPCDVFRILKIKKKNWIDQPQYFQMEDITWCMTRRYIAYTRMQGQLHTGFNQQKTGTRILTLKRLYL